MGNCRYMQQCTTLKFPCFRWDKQALEHVVRMKDAAHGVSMELLLTSWMLSLLMLGSAQSQYQVRCFAGV